MKTCPNCGAKHSKPGTFCSRPCANRRTFTKESRDKTSHSLKQFYTTEKGRLAKAERKELFSKVMVEWWRSNPDRKNKPPHSDTTKQKISKGRKTGNWKLTEKGRRKLSALAKKRKLGGVNSKQSIWYQKRNGEVVFLQSSYEQLVAKDLDRHEIEWSRPAPVKWVDQDNEEHLYYPDFFLPEYGVYLDPKNDYLIKQDEIKIQRVMEQNSIVVLILNKNQLQWADIKSLLE